MMKLTRLGHVALRVADVERSKKFYGEVLGFEVIEEDPEHGGVFMALAPWPEWSFPVPPVIAVIVLLSALCFVTALPARFPSDVNTNAPFFVPTSTRTPLMALPPPPAASVDESKSTDTTHYSVLDSEGNAVAVTTTLNDGFGSHVTATGLGFLLNDEMDDFASKMGVPNGFGLIQGPANAIAAGKRPLSCMMP